ncbi:MAG: AsmA family protein, partial [Proteobacteria bacterium]|nr:AsmA family protein [Pseudomonadota bacterium]
MNRVLLAIGGLLVGLLALLFAAPALVDWNRYRGVFEEEATRFLGREVRVGGRVNLRLLPVPYVQFENVRVADKTANVGRPLFMAEDFTVWLSVGALLSGRIEASELELRRPQVTLVLDGAGSGNWSTLTASKLGEGVLPARVTLDQVKISDGSLVILGPDGRARANYEHINGELSAQEIEGPYRLSAAFASGGAPRELRLSTAKPAADGSVRFKGTVRDPAGGVSISLDGAARDIPRKLAIGGELTARLPLPRAHLTSGEQKGDAAGSGIDLRADLKGDTGGFSLADLNLSFEQGGPPQLATGTARVTWADDTDVSVTLKSRWLDLDRIGGAGQGGTPLELAEEMVAGISRSLATEGRTDASIAIEQATLGGDVVSGLDARLAYVGGKLEIRSLAAALPGGARLTAAGTFTDREQSRRYSGKLGIRGASLARFVGWIAKGRQVPMPARDGPFAASGEVMIASREVVGRGLSIEIGRNALMGEASWRQGSPQAVTLNFEGSEIDLTPLIGQTDDPIVAFKGLLLGLAGDGKDAATDADIKLRVHRLTAGRATFRDAAAELKLAGGNLSVPQMRVASSEGYSLDVRGDIADLARSGAKGALSGLMTASSPAGAAALMRLLAVPPDLVPTPDDIGVGLPLRLAGRIAFGARGNSTVDIAADGTLAASRVAGTMRVGPVSGSWQEAATDLALSIDGRDVERITGRLMGRAGAQSGGKDQGVGRISIRAIGVPRRGLHSLVALEAQGQRLEYNGSIGVDGGSAVALDGDVDVDWTDLGRGLTLAGLDVRGQLRGPARGRLHVTRKDGKLALTGSSFSLAGADASGAITVEAERGRLKVGGDVKLGDAGLAGLLALLSAPAGTSSQVTPTGSSWSEAPLDLGLASSFAGSRITLAIARLAVLPEVRISDARVELSAREQGIEAKLVEGKALDGTATG